MRLHRNNREHSMTFQIRNVIVNPFTRENTKLRVVLRVLITKFDEKVCK